MKNFIQYRHQILVPIQVVYMRFCEKEDTSLNPFQLFILEAIENGNTIEQIVDATLLTNHVIKTEIVQMVSQKLLVKEGEAFQLSRLSQDILMVSRCVKKMNEEDKTAYINLITGEIEAFNSECIMTGDDHHSAIPLNPKISQRDIDSVSVEDNLDFLRSYMDSLRPMDKEDIETVLSSVYIEFKIIDGNKRFYKKQAILRMPCLVSLDEPLTVSIENKNQNDHIVARGKFYKIVYSIKSKQAESNKTVLNELIKINNTDQELLSQKGKDIIEAYNYYKETSITCYYDAVSGATCFEEPETIKNNRGLSNLELPLLKDLSEELRKELREEVRRSLGISEEFILQEDERYNGEGNGMEYTVDCLLSDLLQEKKE